MGRRRGRQLNRQDGRGLGERDGADHRYQMRKQLVTIEDDFWIESSRGQRIFKVDGPAAHTHSTLNFADMQGNMLCKIQEQTQPVKDNMAVEGPDGEQLAMVKKTLGSANRTHFTVTIKDGPDLAVKGNTMAHEYSIGEGRNKVASVSKKWFRVPNTYGVEIGKNQDDIIILAVTACIDQMAQQ